MTPFRAPTSTIIQINSQFLMALILAVSAFWMWPGDPFWWPLGVVSVLCVFASFTLFIQALKSIWILHRREMALKDFLARGKSPKNAKLADDETLKQAGMV